jgi:hypothetical protein
MSFQEGDMMPLLLEALNVFGSTLSSVHGPSKRDQRPLHYHQKLIFGEISNMQMAASTILKLPAISRQGAINSKLMIIADEPLSPPPRLSKTHA